MLTRMDDDLWGFPEIRDLVEVVDPDVDLDLVGAGGAVSRRQHVAVAQDGAAAKSDIWIKRSSEGRDIWFN